MGPWDEAALESLAFGWGEAYIITRPRPDTWQAVRRDNGEKLTAADPAELDKAIFADYTARPVPREVQRDG